jgi:hypothetical protein
MDKRGQFFSLYLVLLTLLMVGTVIGFYSVQQDNIRGSLVSPLSVLEVRDDLEVFEARELGLIKNSLSRVDAEFGSDIFLEEFRIEFIEGVLADGEMREFIFSDLFWDGRFMDVSFDEDSFLENVVYPESESRIDSNVLVFVRAKIGKAFDLRAEGEDNTRFPVDFKFEFGKEYLINKKDVVK